VITGLKGLAADGHEINCQTCRSGKTCNVANAHGYLVGACVEYSPEKPMTNADKIRQMTDEELAEYLCDRTSECYHCEGCGKCHYDKEKEMMTGMIDWLKQRI
jgi:hypothetical protein